MCGSVSRDDRLLTEVFTPSLFLVLMLVVPSGKCSSSTCGLPTRCLRHRRVHTDTCRVSTCARWFLVHPLATVVSSTTAGDFMLVIFKVKFVVISQLKQQYKYTLLYMYLKFCL